MKNQEVRWLLRDKYLWSEGQILDFFRGKQLAISHEVRQDLQRLTNGEPVQYVIGWVDFLGCRIDLSYKPLIPRPETEFWTEQVLHSLLPKQQTQPLRILDLCAGSGCIGIAIAHQLPRVTVDFLDISSEALKQIEINLKLNTIAPTRTRVLHSDLFAAVSNERYEMILTNPPYVDPDGGVSPTLAFEPAEALFAQNHGLRLIERIIFDLKNHLTEQGIAVIEFGQGQERAIAEFLQKANFSQFEFGKDQYGVTRFVQVAQEA
jgi:release factor-specific protein-(glutamine-N5) methyltransferase